MFDPDEEAKGHFYEVNRALVDLIESDDFQKVTLCLNDALNAVSRIAKLKFEYLAEERRRAVSNDLHEGRVQAQGGQ
jgi:hypothetical protein